MLSTRLTLTLAAAAVLLPSVTHAQWTNRYPHVQGYGHHVYLEGYELPTLAAGPTDPAPSPDGTTIALSARGWIWLLDIATGEARRLTTGGAFDFRPAWSPDGARLAFVRDDTRDMDIVVLDLATGRETTVVETPALDLDPAFGPNGQFLYYSSAVNGDIDLWRVDLASGQAQPVTTDRRLELRAQPHPDGERLVYLKKGPDEIRVRHLADGMERAIANGSILSMTRPSLSPDGETVALNWPTQDGWELRITDIDDPGAPIILVPSRSLPLTPAWSADGSAIYYTEADDRERMQIKRVGIGGGPAETIPVRAWNWATPTGRLRIRTVLEPVPTARTINVQTVLRGFGGPTPARIAVTDASGHAAVPDEGLPHFDGQNGIVFFYSPGVIEVEVPAGAYSVAAVRGLTTPVQRVEGRVAAGETAEFTLVLAPVWDARAAGWTSADHHFHLNYGGQYDLGPEDVELPMRGENLDLGTPLLANLHNRFEDQSLFGWQDTGDLPRVWFGQEVRSHFLGHVGLIGTSDLFWPWVWGPGYQTYGTDDRPNTEPLRFARAQGGVSSYVHPVMSPMPFAEQVNRLTVEMSVDAVLGDVDTIELVCLWSDEEASADFWYRVLNLGVPMALSAGTDIMLNLYRTMAVGTTRVYAFTGDDVNWPAYFTALRAGRSFVTNGPMLDFRVEGRGPGEVLSTGSRGVAWELDLRSAIAVDRVELLVNGTVVHTEAGLDEPGTRRLNGQIDIPAGGWIAARAIGGETVWPAMDSYPFAHTAPVWIGSVGSTDPEAARVAAGELLLAVNAAAERLRRGYGAAPTPAIDARFAAAREKLEALAGRED